MHPSVASILRYFTFEHLPAHLQEVSRPLCEIARKMALDLESSPEVTVGLRKLLEAKDAFVRARLDMGSPPAQASAPTADNVAIGVWPMPMPDGK